MRQRSVVLLLTFSSMAAFGCGDDATTVAPGPGVDGGLDATMMEASTPDAGTDATADVGTPDAGDAAPDAVDAAMDAGTDAVAMVDAAVTDASEASKPDAADAAIVDAAVRDADAGD